MKMRSISGQPVYVTDDTGLHCTWIGAEWVEVNTSMVKRAIMSNCIPESLDPSNYQEMERKAVNVAVSRMSLVKDKIKLMFDKDMEGDITNAGYPNLKRLETYVGGVVTREDMATAMN